MPNDTTPTLRVAFDIGGTFTDVVIAVASGGLCTYNIPTLLDSVGVDVSRCLADSLERQAAALVRELLPSAMVCASSEVLPEIREYERTSTTALNAYLMPVVNRYVDQLETQLRQYHPSVLIMQSNGGVMTTEHARRRPVHLIESGPAAGVLAAASLAREIGLAQAVTFVMC